jgi:hypothetical protein
MLPELVYMETPLIMSALHVTMLVLDVLDLQTHNVLNVIMDFTFLHRQRHVIYHVQKAILPKVELIHVINV